MSMQSISYYEGEYQINLFTEELLSLVSGVVPYLAFDDEPDIPPGSLLTVYHETKGNEVEYDPVICNTLSLISFVNESGSLYLLTVKPLDVDFDLQLKAESILHNLVDKNLLFKSSSYLVQSEH